MRNEVVKRFEAWLDSMEVGPYRIAMVGGGPQDPEIESLLKRSECIVDYFGLHSDPSKSQFFLDLNDPPAPDALPEELNYDLVLCSQVLEHVWNVGVAFRNLRSLAAVGGYIWLGVPASNFAHGLPDYFSAGYSTRLLESWAKASELEVVLLESIGSERYYSWIHRYHYWPSVEESHHVFPIHGRGEGTWVRRWGREFKRLTRLLILFRTSSVIDSNVAWATQSICLARRSDSRVGIHPKEG